MFCAAGVVATLAATSGPPPPQAAVSIESPAGAGSLAYGLSTGADGRTYLIWIEPAAEGANVLKFSRLEGQAWSAPREISRGSQWFVNWADHPSITATPDGSLLAHWLVNTGRKQGA